MSKPTKKKIIPRYETKAFMGEIYLNDKGQKDVLYTHLQYRQWELNHFAVGDKIYTKVTNLKRKRTLAQNDFFHLYCSLIAISHGHDVTTDDVKTWAKGKFLSKGITEIFGDKVRQVKGTSDLTVTEMLEFMARIECDSGVPVPNPEPFNLGITHDEYRALKAKQEQEYRSMKPKSVI